jgi:hypothetical protein
MPKGQKNKKKSVTINLQEFIQPPVLGPNRYFYISECTSNCGKRDCDLNCESRSIPYGGQKEFYVKDHRGLIVSKWAEKYYFDATPNSFERLWHSPAQNHRQYNFYLHIPDIPQGGWCEYKSEVAGKENRYRLLFVEYTRRQAEYLEESRRKIVEAHRQREADFQAAKERAEQRRRTEGKN